jgi:ATP-dependent DNA helicase RecQ
MTETYASLRSDEELQPWTSTTSQAEINEEEALVDGDEVVSELAEEPDDEVPGAPTNWDDFGPYPEAMDVEVEPDFTKIHVTPGSGEDLLSLLGERFGYETFKPGQEELIRAVLQGRDAIGILPTGGGKSLIYQYLTMRHGGLTLVISPLLALMDDQMAEAAVGNRRLRAGSLNSSMSDDEWNATVRAITTGRLDLLFLAPESLASAWFELKDARDRIKLIVVDEAHCVSAWGHDFRPAYRDLNNLRKLSTRGAAIPILALTATATERVQTDIAAYLRQLNPIVHRESVVRLNLRLSAQMVLGGLETKLKRLDTFLESRRGLQGVIYCATRKGTEKVANHLQKLGMAARAYHAGMPSQERKGIVSSFLAKNTDVVVATIAFGMGINHSKIRYVVHMNLPSSLDAYTQEIGRAGRDSEPADCLLLHSPGVIRFQLFLAGQVPSTIVRLKRNQVWRMRDFAESSGCRHRGIALHFENHIPNCFEGPCRTSCDKCQ